MEEFWEGQRKISLEKVTAIRRKKRPPLCLYLGKIGVYPVEKEMVLAESPQLQ
jgi:hypothetical protein